MPESSNGRSIQDRASSTATADPQDGFFDKQIEDSGLESLLDARADLNVEKREASAAFKVKDDQVKARLSEFSLAVGEVARIGRYRIEVKRREGGHREFDIAPGERLKISLFE